VYEAEGEASSLSPLVTDGGAIAKKTCRDGDDINTYDCTVRAVWYLRWRHEHCLARSANVDLDISFWVALLDITLDSLLFDAKYSYNPVRIALQRSYNHMRIEAF